jgi:hypothetical protein
MLTALILSEVKFTNEETAPTLFIPERFAKLPEDGPAGPGINIVPFKLLYVAHFNSQASHFGLQHLEVDVEHPVLDDVSHPVLDDVEHPDVLGQYAVHPA